MRAQMDTDVLVLSLMLAPQDYQATDAQTAFFLDHFTCKRREVAEAALAICHTRAVAA